MARQSRLVVADYPHHVILRGNNRSVIFYNDKDRRFFINCLKAAKEKTNSKIYSYCLMPNHVHLIVEPSSVEGLSDMIQSLGRRYVRYINDNYDRTGTLWEGRYRSSLISKDNYLLTCARYIELNPVRAKLVKDPKDFKWSSCRGKVDGVIDELIDKDEVFLGLGSSDDDRQKYYKEWIYGEISDGEIDKIGAVTQKCGVLGDGEFLRDMTNLTGRSVESRKSGRPRKSL